MFVSLVPSDSYAERAEEAKAAKGAEADLLITNSLGVRLGLDKEIATDG